MSFVIQGLGLAQPPHAVPQSELAAAALPCSAETDQQRKLLPALYRRTMVERRHSVVVGRQEHAALEEVLAATQTGMDGSAPRTPELLDALDDQERRERMLAFYPPAESSEDRGPTIAPRMRRYAEEALPLAAEACRAALADAQVEASRIRQLVLVSCTGFSAPGVDIGLIDALGLPPDVGRTLVGFMGCHGAMNGLRVAGALAGAESFSTAPQRSGLQDDPDLRRPSEIASSGTGLSRVPRSAEGPDEGVMNPGSRKLPEHVLLCCVELCTLHFQYGWDPQKVVANALFADGAAAVVGRHVPGMGVCALPHFAGARRNGHVAAPHVAAHGSLLLPDSRDAMTWVIRDHGFEMTLSPRVPDLIRLHLRAWLDPWLASQGIDSRGVKGWAIHPGGPRVISAVEEAMELSGGAGDVSRDVLRECGNMSSPTVLFIVDRLRRANSPRPWVALAFGPGLTIEAALIL